MTGRTTVEVFASSAIRKATSDAAYQTRRPVASNQSQNSRAAA